MLAVATTRLPAGALAPPRRPRRSLVAVSASRDSSANKGQSGIHDPVGWGQRGGAVKPHEAGLEQQRQMQAAALSNAQERSQAAQPGGAGIDRYEAANKEILEVEREKSHQTVGKDMTASDDEWEHMSTPKKWYMEVKALLYSWLGTGVEPL